MTTRYCVLILLLLLVGPVSATDVPDFADTERPFSNLMFVSVLMTINDTIESGYLLPAMIAITPTSTKEYTDEGKAFLRLTLLKGDTFMKTTRIVKNTYLAYVMFYEFVYMGARPKFITYEKCLLLFYIAQQVTGVKFHADQTVFEIVFAHLHRSKEDTNIPYRLTDMKQMPKLIGLSNAAEAAYSTTSKLVGSYFDDSVDSSIVNAADRNSRYEDLLRL